MDTRRHKIAICLGAVTLVALSTFWVSAQEQTSLATSSNGVTHSASVAGTVLRSGTDEPLRKARVTLSMTDDKNPSTQVVVTAADGKFSFQGLAPGAYDLDVEHDGYVAKSYGEESDSQGVADLTLAAGQTITDLVLRLQKRAAISGHIVDEDGDPVRGVMVMAMRRSIRRGKAVEAVVSQVETNDLGEYRIFDLLPARYSIRAMPSLFEKFHTAASDLEGSVSATKSPNSYVSTYYPGVANASSSSFIDLSSGDDLSSINFSLIRTRAYKIRGLIVDLATSGSAREYGLKLVNADGSDPMEMNGLINPDNQSFEFASISPGSYTLTAYGIDPGRSPTRGFARVVVTDADLDSVRLVIKRGADIRGRVAIEGAKTLPLEMVVQLDSRDTDLPMLGDQVPVKADGTFEFTNIYDGLYEVSILSQCTECYLKSGSMIGADVLKTGLQVAGEPSEGLSLFLSTHTGTVDGVVTKDDGSSAARATILLVPDAPYRERRGRYKEGISDQYGRFSIRGVAPGGYRAFAVKKTPEYADDVRDPEFIKQLEPKGEAVSLEENGKKTLQLKLIANDAEYSAK